MNNLFSNNKRTKLLFVWWILILIFELFIFRASSPSILDAIYFVTVILVTLVVGAVAIILFKE